MSWDLHLAQRLSCFLLREAKPVRRRVKGSADGVLERYELPMRLGDIARQVEGPQASVRFGLKVLGWQYDRSRRCWLTRIT